MNNKKIVKTTVAAALIATNVVSLPQAVFASELDSNPIVDTETPEVEVPETEVPEVETPELEVPETEVPEVETPELEVPETEVPEVETPELEVPEIEVPEVETPEVEVPETGTTEVVGSDQMEENQSNPESATTYTLPDGPYVDGEHTFYFRNGGELYKYEGLGGDLVIPEGVTSIGKEAFYNCGLTSVVIPSSVKTIGEEAFSRNELTSITISEGVERIENEAFTYNSLTSAKIPSSVKTIGGYSFAYNQSLTSVEISEGVAQIENGAFMFSSLTSVQIPSTVNTIGEYAFYSNELTSVEIPEGVTRIERGAFYSNQLTSVKIPEGVTRIERSAFSSNQLTSVEIPASVEYLDGFSENNLTSIEIPSSVNTIGEYAFYGNQLTSVEIPEGVTRIETGAFSSNQLTSVEVPESVEYLSGFSQNNLTSIEIPSSVNTIGEEAFADNNLTNIEIAEGVTQIESQAFSRNELTNLPKIPASVEYLSGFSENNLTSVEIPASVNTIGEGAFADNNLTNIEIPSSVNTIGEGAFADNKLTNIEIAEGVTQIESQAFSRNELTNLPKIPASVEYLNGFSENNLTSIEIPGNVKTIGEKAFVDNKLTNIELAEGVTQIESQAFSRNELTNSPKIPGSVEYLSGFSENNLTSVEIPSSVKTIGDGAFAYNNLTSVEILEGVTRIEHGAFSSNNLTSVKIPSSVEYLNGFSENQLISVEIPSSVKTIGEGAFYRNNFTSLNIPEGVERIEHGAFSNNYYLTSVEIPGSVEYLSGFSGNLLTSVKISEGVKIIGQDAFSGNNLTSVEIPEGVTEIGNCAFLSNALTNIDLPDSLITIGSGAFSDGGRIVSNPGGNQFSNVVIPENVTSIGEAAFSVVDYNPDVEDDITFEFKGEYPEGMTGWINIEGNAYNAKRTVTVIHPSLDSWMNKNDEQILPSGYFILNRVVKSNDKPVISGVSNTTLKVGSMFNPLTGISASDSEDGDLTSAIKVTGSVDASEAGTYTLTYTVTDSDGNTTSVERTVIVQSNDKPVISGVSNTMIKVGDAFDALTGISASDSEDGDLTSEIKVSGSVDASKVGTYTLTYTVTDSDGSTTSVERTVIVQSNDKPVISGVSNTTIKVGDTFDALTGISASDSEDGDLTSAIKVSGSVDASEAGTYTLTYTVTDSDGNTTSVERTVTVRSNDKPIISGVSNLTLYAGARFDALAGISASDSEDGDLTSEIKVSGEVERFTAGVYVLTYTVTDRDGNITNVERTITIQAGLAGNQLVDNQLISGDKILLTFGDLSPEQLAQLQAENGELQLEAGTLVHTAQGFVIENGEFRFTVVETTLQIERLQATARGAYEIAYQLVATVNLADNTVTDVNGLALGTLTDITIQNTGLLVADYTAFTIDQGFGPEGDVTPELDAEADTSVNPEIDGEASQGFGPEGNVTPELDVQADADETKPTLPDAGDYAQATLVFSGITSAIAGVWVTMRRKK